MPESFEEFKVVWQQYPYAYNPRRVLFVKTSNAADASILAVNHIERKYGLNKSEFAIHESSKVELVPAGEVL
jgi:hypothetical protein